MSDKKNIITPFRHHSFTFLKMRITLEESGKVTMKLGRNSIKAMRRKLTIFRRWVDEGKLARRMFFNPTSHGGRTRCGATATTP